MRAHLQTREKGEKVENEWQIDLKLPDIGAMATLMATSICSAILGAAEIAYTMMWITSAYERHGKSFFIDLINANDLTWTAEFIVVAGSLMLLSSMVFLTTMFYSLIELNAVTKPEKTVRMKIVFILFIIGIVLLFLALTSAMILRYM
ncbi:hypothetical protein [Methanococcoides methylutens]|uniref:hypothetical protein n=1 Tax=Methanococcoides methylutens TaxID=2226 RepID=UPI001F430677|nr:hypothetical protein [Methanococcoides methylutens]